MFGPIIRASAFISNWIAWVLRQPSMLLTMIVGPFLILGLFALSNADQAVRNEVIVVMPGEQATEFPVETLGEYFDIVEETQDLNWARVQLHERRVDAVIVVPPNPREQLGRGEQAEITVLTNEIDPITLSYLELDVRSQVAHLNSDVQRQGVERTKKGADETEAQLAASEARTHEIEANADNPEATRSNVDELDRELTPALQNVPTFAGSARAGALLLPEEASPITQRIERAERTAADATITLATLRAEANSPFPNPLRIRQLSTQLRDQINLLREDVSAVHEIPTEAVVQPFEGRVEQVVPYRPTLITFFAPAALALLLQHFAVTLAALSMVRARLLGMVEFWQIAPIRASEIVAGNYFSYGVLSLVAWAALTAGTVYILGVPVLGDLRYLVGSALLLILASLGIGFVISLLASNEQQAAQLAMLVLLASVFLSGFARPLETIDFPVRYFSYLLPATFGIQIFQNVMLRGLTATEWHLMALGALSLVGLIMSLMLFRRELRPA